jgi:hypothetical protein
MYSGAVLMNTVGLMPIALILYNGAKILESGEQLWLVPFLYVIVQLVDAPMALVSGYIYDKIGIKFLGVPFALSILPIVFSSLVARACLSRSVVLSASIACCDGPNGPPPGPPPPELPAPPKAAPRSSNE